MQVGNRPAKDISFEIDGKKWAFKVRAEAYTAFDDLLIENRLVDYLMAIGANNPSDNVVAKARRLAKFELICFDGPHIGASGKGAIFDVGSLPTAVINRVVNEYNAQFTPGGAPAVAAAGNS